MNQINASEALRIHGIVSLHLNQEQMRKWEELYGEFDKTNYEMFTIRGLQNESTFYHGEIIKWARDVANGSFAVLFVGESPQAMAVLKEKIGVTKVFSAGLHGADFEWNFENSPPASMPQFDLIISQAILEHLIDPYKHVQDLVKVVAINGYVLIHTVCPGFLYHRYPIDALRFFPDWFEEVAKRLGLIIARKRIKGTHIFYMYKKTA